MLEFLNELGTSGEVIAYVSAVVLVCKLITIWTPTTADDKIMNALLKTLNLGALNVFKDKNADAKEPK